MGLMEYYLGTMGFGYDDWQGAFYPEQMAARNYLGHYALHFNAVEIDTTFYGAPNIETIQRWYHTTPDGFQFALKTPRQITHEKSLIDVQLEMLDFIETVRGLEEKLGVILLQMPPSFASNNLNALAAFLEHLPKDARYALEFRHPSWYSAQDEVGKLLAQYKTAWAATEYPGLPRRTPLTTDFMYIRWIGQHGAYDRHDHERVDKSAELEAWHEHILGRAVEAASLYGFFNNDYAGHAPATCNRFKEIAGLEVSSLKPPQQGTLF